MTQTPRPQFEILDCVETPLGLLYLRRRELLGRRGEFVTEVSLDHELLMSSLNTVSEEALATRALAWHGGRELSVLVGGLGLGYTAAAALATGQVDKLRVIEHLPAVVEWLGKGLVPLSDSLLQDARFEVADGDIYAELLGASAKQWDAVLIDVDHSPSEPLGASSQPFYTAAGLQRVARHLSPDGVLAVWSAADDDAFLDALGHTFAETSRERVKWANPLLDEGEEVEDFLFLARTRFPAGTTTPKGTGSARG